MVATIVTFCGFTWSHYHTLAEEGISLPKFEHTNNKQFLHNVKQCVHHVYYHNDIEKVNLEVLLAQAALESGWGNSRFAREGKNLFGIRTYDLREPHMLPSNKPKKWGVKVYKHECDSVLNYINILNNGKGFSEYRKFCKIVLDFMSLLATVHPKIYKLNLHTFQVPHFFLHM